MKYYTYAYLREDKTPYYIGKGKGNRAYKTGRKGIKPPRDKSKIILLKQNLTEEEAFKHEKYMIAVFGRKDLGTGILRNKTNGGDGASGSIRTDDQKNNLKHKNIGKKHSEETRLKISASLKSAMKGKKHSDETKKKISQSRIGKKHSDETKLKMSLSRKGKPLSNEWKLNLSKSLKSKKEK